MIGFVHSRHLDEQRPDWGRPAPDFIDPIFAVNAVEYAEHLRGPDEDPSGLVRVSDVERLGLGEIDRTFLREALRKRSEDGR